MKYIVLEVADIDAQGERFEREIPVVFPNLLVHKDVADAVSRVLRREQPDGRIRTIKPVAAGFLSSLKVGGREACHGESESLGLQSRGIMDDTLISTFDYLQGIKP